MKKVPILLAAGLAFAGTALAGSLPAAGAATAGPGALTGMLGDHDIQGIVTYVNHHLGLVNMKTSAGTLRLHFPPNTIRTLRAHDKILVELSYKVTQEAAPLHY